jgi:hypothetical protein
MGTVFVERISDLVAFLIIVIGVIFWQLKFLRDYTRGIFPLVKVDTPIFAQCAILGFLSISIIIMILIRLGTGSKIGAFATKLWNGCKEGISTIGKINNFSLFAIYTFSIYLMWLFMLYAVFLAFPPTAHLPLKAALLTNVVGIFAYLIPVQAGLGVWHLSVLNSLFLFGIHKDNGLMFALIAHSFTNLIYLLMGAVAFFILPIACKKVKDDKILTGNVMNLR